MKTKTSKRILSIFLTVLMLMSSFSMIFAHAAEATSSEETKITTPITYANGSNYQKLYDVDFDSENYIAVDDTSTPFDNNGQSYDASGQAVNTFKKGWRNNIAANATVIEEKYTLKIDFSDVVESSTAGTSNKDQRYIGYIPTYDLTNSTYTLEFDYFRTSATKSKFFFGNGTFIYGTDNDTTVSGGTDTNMPNLALEVKANTGGYRLMRQSSAVTSGVYTGKSGLVTANGVSTTTYKIVLKGGAKATKTLYEGKECQTTANVKTWVGEIIPVTYTIYEVNAANEHTRVMSGTFYQPSGIGIVFGVGEYNALTTGEYYGVSNLAIYKGDTFCLDANADHKCDKCKAPMGGACVAAEDSHYCAHCGKVFTSCVDAGEDGFCDVCKTSMDNVSYEEAKAFSKLYDTVNFSSSDFRHINDTSTPYDNNGTVYNKSNVVQAHTKNLWRNAINASAAVAADNELRIAFKDVAGSANQKYVGYFPDYSLENNIYTYDVEFFLKDMTRAKIFFGNGVFLNDAKSSTAITLTSRCAVSMPGLNIELNTNGKARLMSDGSNTTSTALPIALTENSTTKEYTTQLKIVLSGGSKKTVTLYEGKHETVTSGVNYWKGEVIPVTYTIYDSANKEVVTGTFYQPADVGLVFGIGEYTAISSGINDGYFGARNLTIYKGDIMHGSTPATDVDNDHTCDDADCNVKISDCEDLNKDHECDVCTKTCSECVDTDYNHACDICGATGFGTCADANAADGDHLCDYGCGKTDANSVCANTNPADHTCDGDSACKAYADCVDKKVNGSDPVVNTPDHKCDLCGDTLTDCLDNAPADGKCDICGQPCVHNCVDKYPNKDHKCDICGENVGGEHTIPANAHVCAYCGKGEGVLVDYSTVTQTSWVSSGSQVPVNGYLGGAKLAGVALSGSYFTSNVYPDNKEGKYQIDYWFEDPYNKGVALSMVQGSLTAEGTKGRLGWMTVGNDLTKMSWYQNGTAKATITTHKRDVIDGKQYFRVIVDRLTQTMTLFVLSGGEYKEVETRQFYNMTTFFQFGCHNRSNLAEGEYIAFGGVTLTELCNDGDKDHDCDVCGAEGIGTHVSSVEGDHGCAYCGVPGTACPNNDSDKDHKCNICNTVISECKDTSSNHKCNYCGNRMSTCIDEAPADHKCDICGTILTGCGDEIGDGDHKCDNCGEKASDCVDADKDHVCDECGGNVGKHEDKNRNHICDYGCSEPIGEHADANGDFDHDCDYCYQPVDGAVCFDHDFDGICDECEATFEHDCNDDNKDHKCDRCGEPYEAGKHLDGDKDHQCDYGCSESIGDHEDIAPKDHKCDYGCDEFFGEHKDSATDKDHVCDYGCGEVLEDCCDIPKDHKCDVCGVAMGGEHKIEDDAHVCAYCGKGNGQLVDFTGDNLWQRDQKGTETFVTSVGSIKVTGKETSGGGFYGTATDYPIAGHIYEITYTMKAGDFSKVRARMTFMYGTFDQDGKAVKGETGWVLYRPNDGDTANKIPENGIARISWNSIQYPSAKAVVRDIDAKNDGAQSFKVVVDGINNVMELYVVKDGQYVLADVMAITIDPANPNLRIATGSYDAIPGASNYVEMSNVTVYELCSDVDEKDHKCDVCGETVVEINHDEHSCDYCGALGTACKDMAADAVKEKEKAPTCTEAGSYESVVYCTECKAEISRETITVPALEHDYDEGVITTPATCTEKGVKTYTCQNDKAHTYTEDVDALGHTDGDDADHVCDRDGCDEVVSKHNYTTSVTAPTCEDKGYTTYTCACGDSYVDDYVDALGHDYDEGVITTPATCTEKGVKTYTCQNDKAHTYTEDVDALGHTDGDDADHVCDRDGCDEVVSEHNYASKVTAPTCVEKGYTTYTCACGDSYKADYVDALGHSFKNYVADGNATCTVDGTETAKCDNCDENHTRTDVDSALGHSFTNYVYNNDATCTADGTKTADCDRCDELDTVTAEGTKLGHIDGDDADHVCDRDGCDEVVSEHNYASKVTDPTCVEKGYTTYTCACGESYVDDYVDALGHEYSAEWYHDAEIHEHRCIRFEACGDSADKATHTSSGPATEEAAESCTECGYVITPKLDHVHTPADMWSFDDDKHWRECVGNDGYRFDEHAHDFVYVTNNANCVHGGAYLYECSVCGCPKKVESPALGHDYSEWYIVEDPTCTGVGEKRRDCNRDGCDHYESEIIDALGHDFGEWYEVYAPTCEGNGENRRDCKRDGCNHYEIETVFSNGHARVYHDAKDPTCDGVGWHEYETCKNCDYTTYVEIPAIGHSFAVDGVLKEATCTEKGIMGYVCTNNPAHKTTGAIEINSEAHAWKETGRTEATCSTEGTIYYECEHKEGHRKTEQIESNKDAHEYSHYTSKYPTCSEKGVETYVCKFNPEHTYTEEIDYDLTAHKDEDNNSKCDDCDAQMSNHEHAFAFEVVDKKYLASAADCENAAVYYMSCACGHAGTKTFVYGDALGHEWGEATLVWSEDNTSCTATRVCAHDAKHKDVETVKVDFIIVEYATCEKDGEICYIANFSFEKMHKNETIPAPGHNYGEWIKEIPAECEKEGTLGHYYCDVCQENFDADKKVLDSLVIEALEHADIDLDHACDNDCGTYMGEHLDANYDHNCDYGCKVAIGKCEDKDLDHDCDYGCDKFFGEHKDSATDDDHVCDYGCGEALEECYDGNDNNHSCDVCGNANVSDHDYEEEWFYDDESHCHKCTVCGFDSVSEKGFHYYNQMIATNEYLKTPATETTKAVYYKSCICGKAGTDTFEAGELVPHDCIDEDLDHDCDICGTAMGVHADGNKDHNCDYGCSDKIGNHVDGNKDHACDYGCTEKIGDHVDGNKDHNCDYGCAEKIGTCADANKDHKCDYGCTKYYGEHVDENKDHNCDYGCTDKIGTCADANKDHKCDYGCDKVYGEHKDGDKDHACDYGCADKIGEHKDAKTDDGDHNCDYCGKADAASKCVDNNKDHKCDTDSKCTVVFGTCADADKDHGCDYGCDKVYGTHADADKDHNCDYGCTEKIGTCADADKDHDCDYGCDKVYGTHADANKDHNCDYGCTDKIGTCADANKDHKCDYGCTKYYGEHKDANKDHNCDYGCADKIGTCADANKDHACDYGCDKYYGEHKDAKTDDGDHNCDYCGKADAASKCVDNNKDHKCDTDSKCTVVFGTCADADKDHDCDYGCDKVYGTHADADKDHNCDYGCADKIGTCADANKDHACDYGCDKVYGTHADADKDHNCDYGCTEKIGTCADTDKDHDCDYGCDKVYGTHADADKDHNCDYGCTDKIGTCADANKDHYCDYGCGKYYGTHADENKDHNCDYGCSVVIGEHADSAEDNDHVCDYGCGAVLENCADQAGDGNHSCDVCGKDSITACDDANRDHNCDECDRVLTACADNNKDHNCDWCGTLLSVCDDADKNHSCDWCETSMGEHVAAENEGKHTCNYCGETVTKCVDTTGDRVCEICGKVMDKQIADEIADNIMAEFDKVIEDITDSIVERVDVVVEAVAKEIVSELDQIGEVLYDAASVVIEQIYEEVVQEIYDEAMKVVENIQKEIINTGATIVVSLINNSLAQMFS